jgi:hypothetical protein
MIEQNHQKGERVRRRPVSVVSALAYAGVAVGGNDAREQNEQQGTVRHKQARL